MRRAIGGVAAIVLLLLIAAPAVAGGWASITPDEASAHLEPKEGEAVELGFTVLQHGETPAPWERPTVILMNAVTGERLEVAATSDGSDGHFTARVTFPEAGLWSWRVDLADLESDSPTTAVSVLTADGRAPKLDAATLYRVADETAVRVREEMHQIYGARVEALERQAEIDRAAMIGLRARLDSVSAATPAAPDSLPPLAVILLAVVAGSASAFVMTFLARPAPPATDPAAQPGYAPR